ncbi:hypothetical protein K439DRAFT_1633275 [Ramaria rubella]|nr:hypothetical protein K439DRAFT_1633275 [Ramaria rubella]
MALIRALPPDCNSFVDSLFLLDKLTLASLRGALHNRENQAALRDTFVPTPAAALKASTTPTALVFAHRSCGGQLLLKEIVTTT